MRYLLALALLLAMPCYAQQWKAGATLSGWQGDATIASGGTTGQTGDTAVPYNMHRWGVFTLNAPIANGRYTVKLYFRESSATAAGQRLFHIAIEGARVETSLDVQALAGRTPLIRTYTVDVADGNVTVEFIRGAAEEPMYSALEVSLVAPGPPPGPTWTGNQRLSWTPPTMNNDGSTLTDLAGFVIQYGNTRDALTWAVRLSDPGLTEYNLTGLAPGRYYIGVLAFNAAGVDGVLSNLAEFQLTESLPACPSKPADETQVVACQIGSTGSWTQTRTYTPATYPTCWTGSEWLPANAPAGSCVVIPPPVAWTVRAITAGTRPAYELVRNQADTAWERGYKLGDVAVGKPCESAKEPVAGEYHRVAQGDVTLLSPTYRGRTVVAVCSRN